MKMKIKKWDIIIIGLLLVISFLPYILIKEFVSNDVEGIYAYIAVGGKSYKEIPLTGQVNRKEFVIKTEYGENTIAIENESIAVIEADCHDHVCESFGYKHTPGDVIVCLPNQLYIEVRGNTAHSNVEQDARG